MEENLQTIKTWLATGSINIFGLPYSGKDTVGIKLAELIGAKFLSSGLILRNAEKNDRDLGLELGKGLLASTDKFRDLVLPYFGRPDIAAYPLVLSSVGRWIGEEAAVIEAAAASNHELKAVILLNVSEADIENRWRDARVIQDRGQRNDDKEQTVLKTRIAEFHEKTFPVITYYRNLGILVPINADQPKEAVLNETITKLAEFANLASA